MIEDVLPTGTRFISASNGGQFANGRVTWNVGPLAPGAAGDVSLVASTEIGVVDGTTLTNAASATASNASPVSASAGFRIAAEPDLRISKSADISTGEPGDTIRYTLTYENTGNAAATGVVITDTLPAATSFVSAGAGVLSGDTVTWTVGDVAVGGQGTLDLAVQIAPSATSGDLIVNRASIDANETQPKVSNDVVVRVSDLPIAPVLALDIVGNPTVVGVGEPIVYTINYRNETSQLAVDPIVAGVLPSGTTFRSAGQGGVLKQAGSVQYVEWSVPDLAGGGSGTVDFTVALDSTGVTGTPRVSSIQGGARALNPALRSAISGGDAAAANSGQQPLDSVVILAAFAAIEASNVTELALALTLNEVIVPAPPVVVPTPVPAMSMLLLAITTMLLVLLAWFAASRRAGYPWTDS